MIIFIDDLDRCTPSVTVEVLQAINLFVSGQLSGCRFVIGLDQAIVAKQIGEVYGKGDATKAMTYRDDPSPGWTFLRKLIQLPILLPRLDDEVIKSYVNALLGSPEEPATDAGEEAEGSIAQPSEAPRTNADSDSPHHVRLQQPPQSVARVPTLLELHGEVRKILNTRLAGGNGFSGRETKRFLSVWQFYLRVAINTLPDMTLANGVDLAKNLVYACEIIVRWPAYITLLCTPIGGTPALKALSSNVDDDFLWDSTLAKIGNGRSIPTSATNDLRRLLRCAEAEEVADLTVRLV
jgi:hypothetical protein